MANDSESANTTNTSSQTIKRDLSTGQGNITNLSDFSIGNVGGGVTFTTADADVAKKALDTVGNIGSEVTDTVKILSRQAQDSADKVVASQAKFVEAASGQTLALKALTVIVVGLGLFFIVPQLFGGKAKP